MSEISNFATYKERSERGRTEERGQPRDPYRVVLVQARLGRGQVRGGAVRRRLCPGERASRGHTGAGEAHSTAARSNLRGGGNPRTGTMPPGPWQASVAAPGTGPRSGGEAPGFEDHPGRLLPVHAGQADQPAGGGAPADVRTVRGHDELDPRKMAQIGRAHV